MTFRGVVVHVDAKHTGEQTEISFLAGAVLVVGSALISDRKVEKTVVSEEESATVVPVVAVVLIDEDKFRRLRNTVGCCIPGETGEAAVRFVLLRVVRRVAIVDEEIVSIQ
jgi:hypothetical protein